MLTAVDRLNVDLTLLPNYRVKTFYEKLTYPSPGRLPTAGGLGEAFTYPSTLALYLVSYLWWSEYELGSGYRVAYCTRRFKNPGIS